MVSATRAAHEIEVTAESLQEDLARLEIQKRALERELAAVAAHLDSVQRALSALTVLMAEPSGRRATEQPEQPEQPKADTPAVAPARTTRKQAAPRQEAPTQKEKPAPSSRAEADEQRSYGALTEQILEYFAGVGDAEVRARDVAAALGRDTDSGSINAVRSTLDRLVGTSRVRRAGRGLYRAQKS
ncbi:hypothetical protein ACFY0P_50630 [Streptomyces sp. NPDC001714]|uniref:hypothetical protein n=1 Tax=Streptomyces sp. NPDC001714 TaxID=3364603 RepID=UPI0036B797BB